MSTNALQRAVEAEQQRKAATRRDEGRTVWFPGDVLDFYVERAKASGVSVNGLIIAVLREAKDSDVR